MDRERPRRGGGGPPTTPDRRQGRGTAAGGASGVGDGAASGGVRNLGDRADGEARKALTRSARARANLGEKRAVGETRASKPAATFGCGHGYSRGPVACRTYVRRHFRHTSIERHV